MTHRYRFIRLLVLFLLFVSARANATMVIPLNLEQMTQFADRIFLGTVVSVDSGYDRDGRWCQFIDFEVDEVYKGDLGKTLRIKQINPQPPASSGNIVRGSFIPGVPQYTEQEEVLIFLNGDSPIGFTSPVGLGQGKFHVQEDESGQKKLINGFENIGLFKGMQAGAALEAQGIDESRLQSLQVTPQELSLEQMKSILQTLTASQHQVP